MSPAASMLASPAPPASASKPSQQPQATAYASCYPHLQSQSQRSAYTATTVTLPLSLLLPLLERARPERVCTATTGLHIASAVSWLNHTMREYGQTRQQVD
jgi:hypothetical protein